MAVHGFRGLGWFLCGVIVAPTCYMVTSHGASERARLRTVEAAIVQARKDIRALDTEFATRANVAQLQRWNGRSLAMDAPHSEQYLASNQSLAAFEQQQAALAGGGGAPIQTAAVTVPVVPGTPAEAAPAAVPAVAPALQAAMPVRVAKAEKPEAAPVSEKRVVPVRVARQDAPGDGVLKGLMQKVDRSRLAHSDKPLLSASTISDLRRMAKREQLAQR